ncbi:hypothetical protein HPP92_028942 [Vanilla planifolia]|uniref:Uncharacterized protein n=1 Tax=Vanilla planifolia TaxID=51239 RepID=A0A835P486_VANPL|nr:hypothetical protein HPP92_028932 [Vanilla planifolia]KAG0446239.1 hypothetical protein HPP92_028942 [Vanilla planifolia]
MSTDVSNGLGDTAETEAFSFGFAAPSGCASTDGKRGQAPPDFLLLPLYILRRQFIPVENSGINISRFSAGVDLSDPPGTKWRLGSSISLDLDGFNLQLFFPTADRNWIDCQGMAPHQAFSIGGYGSVKRMERRSLQKRHGAN